MDNKEKKNVARLDALRVILSSRSALSQRELLEQLARAGHRVSQPTLSLDLKKLHVIRVKAPKGYEYRLPEQKHYRRPVAPEVLPDYLKNTGFVSVCFSGPLMVLRTRPGYAQGLAADIDAHRLPTVAGTVAGHDTIFVAMAEGAERQQLIDELASVVPALKSVLP